MSFDEGPKIAPITKGIATWISYPLPVAATLSEDSPDHKGDCDPMAAATGAVAGIGSEDSPDHKGDCDLNRSDIPLDVTFSPKIAPITKGIATYISAAPAGAEVLVSEDSPDHKGDCDS